MVLQHTWSKLGKVVVIIILSNSLSYINNYVQEDVLKCSILIIYQFDMLHLTISIKLIFLRITSSVRQFD